MASRTDAMGPGGEGAPPTSEAIRGNVALRSAEALARRQGGVISRRQLLALGVPRWRTRAQVNARRWRRLHRQTIVVHTGPIPAQALQWAAVFEAGSRGALDGVSSLIAAGLRGFSEDRQRVSVPRGTRVYRSPRINIRQTRRWRRSDIVSNGVPRVRTEVAAVHAALWAQSNRQAALILAMTVQQRLANAEDIARALLEIRRDRRRRFVEKVLLDLMGGAESLGEIDFAVRCRRRGLPEPDRQVVREGRGGNYFLDVYWEGYGVVLEVDGIHHLHATNVVADALRQNHVSLDGDTVLRLPLLGLRVAEDAFFGQIETALRRGGWKRPKAA
jgi:very-short-patch-repair endonuclease